MAVIPLPATLADGPESAEKVAGVPGYEDTIGRGGQRTDRPVVIQKGEEALGTAIDAMAAHIGLIAQRLGSAIGASAEATAQPGAAAFGIESVEVSFGITLSAGLQTVFTAQAESSAQVTVTLSRQP
jgi:hypothetical protein